MTIKRKSMCSGGVPVTERVSNPCVDDRCIGHLGKFATCRTEALYVASMDDGESTGSTEAHGYYTLLIFTEPQDIDISNHPSYQHMVTVPAGWYIVENQDSGAVYHAEYESEQEARAAFLVEEQRYALWDNTCGMCDKQREDDRSDDILCRACETRDLARVRAYGVKLFDRSAD